MPNNFDALRLGRFGEGDVGKRTISKIGGDVYKL